MRLFIAEKPKVGRALAAHFGIIKNCDGYIETKQGLVGWCSGHLIGQAMPPAYGYTSFPGDPASLPIIPSPWKSVENKASEGLIRTLKALIHRADVTEIIHAGDAEREGQLIVDEILEMLGNRKPVKRLWINATNPTAIEKGLASMKSNDDYKNLYAAAVARERADWLVGMNLSRVACLIAGRGVFSAGRVQTPVLALIARRQREIEKFVARDYYVPAIKVHTDKGDVVLEWVGDPKDPSRKFFDKADAQKLLEGLPKTVTLKVERTSEQTPPPLPFHLATLQQWASKSLGISPTETLNRAQTLYLDGALTYPRVDCAYYPEEEWPDARRILPKLASVVAEAAKASPALKSRAWNTKKITSAHYGLMPTDKVPSNLPPALQPIYDIVSRSYIAQFYPNLQKAKTRILTTFQDNAFHVIGSITTDPGWTVVMPVASKDKTLPNIENDTVGTVIGTELVTRTTTPPQPYTQGNIVTAMVNIASTIDDPVARKYLNDADGLGRASTRDQIVPTLMDKGYIELTGGKDKTLHVTEKGFALLEYVPKIVADPVMTALWERDLNKIDRGELTYDAFYADIVKNIKMWVSEGLTRVKSGVVWVTDKKEATTSGGGPPKPPTTGKGKGGSKTGGARKKAPGAKSTKSQKGAVLASI